MNFVAFAEPLRQQGIDVATLELLAKKAEELFRSRVGDHNFAIAVDNEHWIRGSIEQHAAVGGKWRRC